MAIGAVRVTGIVLSSIPMGDYDRRLVILTKEKGKITVFAKGARRPTSAFLAYSQPFTYAVFELYAGKSSYQLQGATDTRYFPKLREDISGICYAMYFCELADYFARENNNDLELLKLLYKSLAALNSGKIDMSLAAVVYEWKAYYINGIGARVFECVRCKSTEAPMYFCAESGGILCRSCMKVRKAESAIKTTELCDSTLYTLQYIANTGIDRLYDFNVSKEVLNELKTVVKTYRELHIDRKIKSLESLENLLSTEDNTFH